ncbi:hypothetical protein [Methanosarcina sp.]|jgi:hypothetical protein|uniref:hypothetical protein n=1 Tax=Methanosarcina sp. TaxID=2213 RepID=UPI002BECB6EA|nr:hypothetical protein [Methanosarcina sp.]HOW14251.1 hypothetical protein [Methanosarcina sp.]
MDEYFGYLVERAQYFERFEFFREDCQKVRAGLNSSEQNHKEVIIVELILRHNQEKNGSYP